MTAKNQCHPESQRRRRISRESGGPSPSPRLRMTPVTRLHEIRARLRDEALRRGKNPRDVDLLLSDLLDKPITYVIAHGELELDPAPLEAMLARRWAGEPLQYIRGRTEFYS